MSMFELQLHRNAAVPQISPDRLLDVQGAALGLFAAQRSPAAQLRYQSPQLVPKQIGLRLIEILKGTLHQIDGLLLPVRLVFNLMATDRLSHVLANLFCQGLPVGLYSFH